MSDAQPWEELEDEAPEDGPRRAVRLKCGKIRFNTGSAVFPYAGIEVLKGVLLYLDQLEEPVKVLIAAHTDTTDSHTNNQILSDQRARSTLHMLEFNPGAWATLCHEESKGSKQKDIDQALKWASKSQKWPCWGKSRAENVRAFKEAYLAQRPKTTLTDTGPEVDAGFWRRVFMLYQMVLYSFLRSVKKQSRKEFLKNLEWVDPEHKAIGCSERCLLKPTADGRAEPENRRTVFLFFPPGQEPKPDDEDLPASDTRKPQDDPNAPLPPLWLEAVYQRNRYAFFDLDCPRPHWMGRELPEGNVLFVVDASGSMAQKSKWNKLRTALVGAISSLIDSDHFGVLAYSTQVAFLWGDASRGALLKPATEANRDAAIDWINAQEPNGGTFVWLAFDAAFKSRGLRTIATERGERNTIEFLSDGSPTPRKRKCDSCDGIFTTEAGSKTCPLCGAENKTFLRGWSQADEQQALKDEVQAGCAALKSGGWRFNSTAFVNKDLDPKKDPLRLFMEELSQQTDPPGSFAAIGF